MKNYPIVIESGTGEQLTFLRKYVENGAEYIEAANTVKPGGGPPMHVHHLQDESFTVAEGLLAAQTQGQQVKYYRPGETVFFPRGVAHKFWNAGNTTLKCNGFVTPVYNFEYFLTAIFRSTKEGGKGRPQTFDAAFLLHRYQSEFDMFDIPWVVKKVIFPLTRFTGRLKGRHKKYSDAPPPVKYE
jgi:quercetin dioxygenase-like cupin family protein